VNVYIIKALPTGRGPAHCSENDRMSSLPVEDITPHFTDIMHWHQFCWSTLASVHTTDWLTLDYLRYNGSVSQLTNSINFPALTNDNYGSRSSNRFGITI